MQKTIQVPAPNPDEKGAAQSLTLEDLQTDSIIVQIDEKNAIFVDDEPLADPSTLASLAKMTGGESLAPEQLTSLLRRIKAQPLELELGPPKKTELWDDWPFFSLFVGLLCVEWFLRKKWGLV